MKTSSFFLGLVRKGKFFFYAVIVEKGVYFLVYVYLARVTTVAQYGELMATFVFANILNAVFEFGFAPYIQREAASKASSLTKQLGVVTLFKLVGFLPYAFFTILYFLIAGTTNPAAVILISLALYISNIGRIFSGVFFGLDRYNNSFYALLFSRVVIFAGIGILFFTTAEPWVVLLLLLCAMILQGVFLLRDLNGVHIPLSLDFDFALLKSIMKSSLPIGIGILCVWVYDKLDVLLINHFLGSESVSYYAVAYSIYKMPQILTGVVLVPLFTSFSNRYSIEKYLSVKEIAKPAVILLALSVIMILACTLFPELILKVTYGEKYAGAAWILSSLAPALPGLFLNNLTGVVLNSVRNERKAMSSAIYAFLLNVSMNIILLPVIGLRAAVLATVCVEYFILGIQLVYLKKSKSILWRQITS